MRIDNVFGPKIKKEDDVIVDISSTAICGSDIHLFNGLMPTLEEGDILGHEFMGEVVGTGREVTELEKGDRVVVPFTISCGLCHFCDHEQYAFCDNSNRNATMGAKNAWPFTCRYVRLLASVRRI